MKKLLIAGAFALASIAGTAQAAPIVSYNAGSSVMPVGSTIIQDFGTTNAVIGTNAISTNVSNNSTSRPAFGSTGNYGAILSGGSYSLTFAPTNLFSFVIGSLDTFNTLVLNYQGGSVTYQGGQIVNDLSFDNGNKTSAETNGVVSYAATNGQLITGATFSSTGNAFEIDNLAVGGAVPEPATWGMMILGFGLVGGALRRRSAAKVSFA